MVRSGIPIVFLLFSLTLDDDSQYIIMNLAISENFGVIDLEQMTFPAQMSIDYVRVYQPKDAMNTGCDPKAFPTAEYIGV